MSLKTDLIEIPEEDILASYGPEKSKLMCLSIRRGNTIASVSRDFDVSSTVVRHHAAKVISQCRRAFPKLSVRANQAATALNATTLEDLALKVIGADIPNVGQETVDEIQAAFKGIR